MPDRGASAAPPPLSALTIHLSLLFARCQRSRWFKFLSLCRFMRTTLRICASREMASYSPPCAGEGRATVTSTFGRRPPGNHSRRLRPALHSGADEPWQGQVWLPGGQGAMSDLKSCPPGSIEKRKTRPSNTPYSNLPVHSFSLGKFTSQNSS